MKRSLNLAVLGIDHGHIFDMLDEMIKEGCKCNRFWTEGSPLTLKEFNKKYPNKKIGILTFNTSFKSDAISYEIILSKNKDLQEAASKLYDALHELDHLNLDVIIAEKLPETGLGNSMNDRLQRAAFSN